ncbi:hypothetical protein F1559_004838 [Cyanidiococcus yangmingshanensis]|uniref:Uncharacterized protein n=1 Tax=Cyanidiococcus yangmingshanensis TaxID=2690220 RepID=A0A7J7IPD7_9RHOD|nr:hypothetical protein F1559_004838 [Cyanidiococcus yangmingshanensis]
MPWRSLQSAWVRLVDALVERRTDWRQLQHQNDTLHLFLLAIAYEEGVHQAQSMAQRLLPPMTGQRADHGRLWFGASALRTLWKQYIRATAFSTSCLDNVPDHEEQWRLVERVNKRQVEALLAAAANDSSSSTRSKLPFTLVEAPSRATATAGSGVYLQGHARIGAVVAFYPGIAYRAAVWSHMPGYPHVAAQNPYLFARYDRVIIDAYPQFDVERALMDVPVLDRTLQRLAERLKASQEKHDWWASLHPYAMGHRVNHPPQGAPANVIPCSWTFDLGHIPPNLLPFIPNRRFDAPRVRERMAVRPWPAAWTLYRRWLWDWANDETVQPSLIPGLVLVAMRDLQNEELFLNYRYNPTALERVNAPDWYWQPDAEAAQRRWS